MKFSMKMAVLSMAGVLALGGAATAASFIFNEANANGKVLTEDSALILEWGSETSDVSDLTSTQSVYRNIDLSWNASDTSIGGVVVLTLTLEDISKAIVVEVATEEWNMDTTAISTLSTKDSDTGIFEEKIKVTDALNVEETRVGQATFYLKFSIDESVGEIDIDGTLTAKLSREETF